MKRPNETKKAEILRYIKAHKKLPPLGSQLKNSLRRFRKSDSKFNLSVGKLLTNTKAEIIQEKKKMIINYIKKNKAHPSRNHSLRSPNLHYRANDPKFKKETDAVLKKAGYLKPKERALKRREEILAYIKKNRHLPKKGHPLHMIYRYARKSDAKFKREVDKNILKYIK